jgi:hypothetical protein
MRESAPHNNSGRPDSITAAPAERALERYSVEDAAPEPSSLTGVKGPEDDATRPADRTVERYLVEQAPPHPTPLLNDFMTPSTRPAGGTNLTAKLEHGRIPKARAFEQW